MILRSDLRFSSISCHTAGGSGGARPRRVRGSSWLLFALLLSMASSAGAQSLVTTMTLSRDELGLIKTSQGISTKLSFQERIKEVICGDLYNPADGKGNFVVYQSDNDVFLKPVAPSGVSNLFVKTGDKGEYTYSFELMIVPVSQSYRIVNLIFGPPRKPVSAKATRTPSFPIIAKLDSVVMASSEETLIGPMSRVPVRLELDPNLPLPPVSATLGARIKAKEQPKEAARRSTVELVALQREVIKREKPLYPAAAIYAGVTGEVVVEIIVNHQGRVTSARALSGPLSLKQAAVSAARLWKFKPLIAIREGGNQVQEVGTIKFVFKSADEASTSTADQASTPTKHK